MAKQELLDKLRTDAETRAQEITSEAKAKADALIAAAEEERNSLMENVRKVAMSAAPDVLKRARSMAELEVRKILLSRKQSVIAEAYAEALAVIRNDARYPKLLAGMISSAAEKGDVVVFAAADKKAVKVAEVLEAVRRQTGLTLKASEEYGDFCGGIVLRGAACDKNLTLDVELDALRSAGEIKYDALFD